MNIDRLADQILKEVGGKDNIKEMFHCVTRLRFYLKDRSVVNPDRLKALDGVLGVQGQTEQLQIIIGNEVEALYTNGPAGGCGAVKRTRDIVSVASILVSRYDVKPEAEIFEV